jgi:hypothetical protein
MKQVLEMLNNRDDLNAQELFRGLDTRPHLATRSRDTLPLEERLIAEAILYLKTKLWSRNNIMTQINNRKCEK